jgi:hypothetical protein
MVLLAQLFVVASAAALASPAKPGDKYLTHRQLFEDTPDFELSADRLTRRQDYNQNYKTGGSVNYVPTSNGYAVSFSGAGDFVVGKGWRTGTQR